MKNVWIFNHYATGMYKSEGGRHFWFSENLIHSGYTATVFCASTYHNSDEPIRINKRKYTTGKAGNVPFVFVKTPQYYSNGIKRIRNMFTFFRNLFPVSREYARKNGKPDKIIASSVHPLTMLAGIIIARKFEIPCISEVRDLWPESIVAYGLMKRTSIIAKLFYKGEKWIYKRSDAIIMTWKGGADYIKEKGWDKDIGLSKITYISNGIDINAFDYNSNIYRTNDEHINDTYYKNIVYAGSIRKVNNLGVILDAAKIIKNTGNTDVRFIIYGDGNEKEGLEKRCTKECIDNVIFKGRVAKKHIPYILCKAYINLLHNTSTSLDKYGQSQNKFFEYLAAGKCIVQTYSSGYNFLQNYSCGVCALKQTPDEIAKTIVDTCKCKNSVEIMGKNARVAAREFDYSILTAKLIAIIEGLAKL